jgi:hypothetical protein
MKAEDIDKLYLEHDNKYDEFEEYIQKLRNMRLIDDHHVRRILEIADDVVELNGRYEYDRGRYEATKWFRLDWWRIWFEERKLIKAAKKE